MAEPLSPQDIAILRDRVEQIDGAVSALDRRSWQNIINAIDARDARIETLEERLAAAEGVVEKARSLMKDADAFGEMILVGKDGPKPDRIAIHTAAKLAGRGSVSTGCSGLRTAVSTYDALLTPR